MASWLTTLKRVPKWAWLVGGGLVLGGILLATRKASAKPLLPGERRLVVLGDSLTVGYLPYLRQELSTDEVLGAGYGGRMVAYISEKADQYLSQNPTHVVVFAGINNLNSDWTAEKTYADLAALWRKAKATGALVVAVQLTPAGGASRFAPGSKRAAQRETLNQYIRNAVGSADGVDAVIDTESLGDGSALLKEYAASDGLHLNATGYRALAELVARGLP